MCFLRYMCHFYINTPYRLKTEYTREQAYKSEEENGE
jgi:hypothetical protein